MAPQKLLECLKNVQTTSNNITIAHIAVSQAVGEYIEFLSSDEPFEDVVTYVAKIQACFKSSADALVAYCDATSKLAKLREEDMQYE